MTTAEVLTVIGDRTDVPARQMALDLQKAGPAAKVIEVGPEKVQHALVEGDSIRLR